MRTSTKKCPRCEVEKPLTTEFFSKNRSTSSGFSSWCKACRNAYYSGDIGKRIKPRVQEGSRCCPHCKSVKPLTKEFWHSHVGSKAGFSSWCKECSCQLQFANRKALKIRVLSHYSGGTPKCSCPNCGINEVKFLTIDHINGDGSVQKRKHGYGAGNAFYWWIIRQGFPSDLRVLCYNCNNAVRWGPCPHEGEE